MKRNLFLLIFFIILSFIFRFYNIDITARFTQDESRDLVRMHEYFENRKITLVGPISNTNTKVFGSLTYYMLMPFAIVGNFEPISPVYGMIFWGVVTAFFLINIAQKVNKPLLAYIALLALFWYPLLETSRWAWNPHLVLFWIALGIWLYFKKTNVSFFLSGLSFSLSFHNHYIALVATSLFIICESVLLLRKKRFKKTINFISGYMLGFIPFVIFDLRHPPGLFFNHYLSGGNIANTKFPTLYGLFHDISNNTDLFFQYLTQNQLLAIIALLLCAFLIVKDIKQYRKNLLFIIPVIGQIIVGAFLDTIQTRYLIPGFMFFIVWILLKRNNRYLMIQKALLIIFIVGAFFSIIPQLNHTEVHPDIKSLTKMTNTIETIIKTNKLTSVNVAQLASPASDTLAYTLRDVLQIKDIHLLSDSQYTVSQNLIVASTSDEKTLRKDKAVQMQIFKDAKMVKMYPIAESPWKVYWFRK